MHHLGFRFAIVLLSEPVHKEIRECNALPYFFGTSLPDLELRNNDASASLLHKRALMRTMDLAK